MGTLNTGLGSSAVLEGVISDRTLSKEQSDQRRCSWKSSGEFETQCLQASVTEMMASERLMMMHVRVRRHMPDAATYSRHHDLSQVPTRYAPSCIPLQERWFLSAEVHAHKKGLCRNYQAPDYPSTDVLIEKNVTMTMDKRSFKVLRSVCCANPLPVCNIRHVESVFYRLLTGQAQSHTLITRPATLEVALCAILSPAPKRRRTASIHLHLLTSKGTVIRDHHVLGPLAGMFDAGTSVLPASKACNSHSNRRDC